MKIHGTENCMIIDTQQARSINNKNIRCKLFKTNAAILCDNFIFMF